MFSANNYSDAGGAVIDIATKELVGDKELNLDLSGGYNAQGFDANFLKMDGVNYWGASKNIVPVDFKTQYSYGNSLNPSKMNMPMDYSRITSYNVCYTKLLRDGTIFGAQTGVPNSVKTPNQTLQGYPAIPVMAFHKSAIVHKNLPELQKLIYSMQKKIEELEKKIN